MLINLHVKNFALIEEADVDFGEGLNILTGETGAGKSILIDSVNAALGARVRGEMIRSGCDSAYVELTFSIPEEDKRQKLAALGVDTEYECITVSRKILPHRSVHKINGETVTSGLVRQVTELLIDIHGQHEHQSLMNRAKHLEVLDEYGGSVLWEQRERTARAYKEFTEAEARLAAFDMDPETRLRQLDFLEFEIHEIEEADVRPGETEELEQKYKRMLNSQRICENLQAVSQNLSGGRNSVQDMVSASLKEMNAALRYDDGLTGLQEELAEIEDLMSGFLRELDDYMSEMTFDTGAFREMEERLDILHRLESKYGAGYDAIQQTLAEKEEQRNALEEYERNKEKAERAMEEAEEQFLTECEALSDLRMKAAPSLREELEKGIRELNFSHVDFKISFGKSDHPGRLGWDEVEFMISLNPGEPARALGSVASGGELSRIMLAIKTVLADKDEIPTLIFDEIDTGISGRTAQKVSEKLCLIGAHRQVLCITHLPQIASMADRHYEIRKLQEENHTVTNIRLLNESDSIGELARLLGGAEMTETVFQNAVEMKLLASAAREKLR